MNAREVLNFLHEVENLKKELRHSWMSNGRHESVAEHTWRVCMMAMLMEHSLDESIDMERVLKIAIVHDISEVYIGDIPAFSAGYKYQKEQEKECIQRLRERFPDSEATQEICDMWDEYAAQISLESRFVKALDKLEVRIQHNEANIATWNELEFPRSQYTADRFCAYDTFLTEFNELVKVESKEKIINEDSTHPIETVIEDAKRLREEDLNNQ